MRWLFILHRYLGVAVGFLVALWCLSGIVMMYVDFPALSDKDRLRSLTPLSLNACCVFADEAYDDTPVFSARLENMIDAPILRVRLAGPGLAINLQDGGDIEGVDEAQAKDIALSHGAKLAGADAKLAREETIDVDQWTVGGEFRSHRPLYKFAFDDADKNELYISSNTGELMQRTTQWQRFWNWLGAVPHWLYPTQLRANGPLWTEIVIWTSVLGTFLTVTGLYLGIRQFTQRPAGRVSGYQGLFLWHHLSGLIFGIFTLGWVVSGLLSMNPWGLLESEGGAEVSRLRGTPQWIDVKQSIVNLTAADLPPGTVSLNLAQLGGQIFWLASDAGDKTVRLNSEGQPAPLSVRVLDLAAKQLAGDNPIASAELATDEDDYYFSLHDKIQMPVYRVVLNDPQRTRYYLNPLSGALIGRIDENGRLFRWWHLGLHRLDFFAWLRLRPVWDVFMIVLLLGATVGAGTGTWMAAKRIKRDITRRG